MSKEVIRPVYNLLCPPPGVPPAAFFFIVLAIWPIWLVIKFFQAFDLIPVDYYEHPDGSFHKYPPKD